jgi:MFS family permease
VIGLGLVLWILAVAATGFAGSLAALFAARLVTGVGEASATPASLVLIGRRIAPRNRGGATGIFIASASIGAELGASLGGILSQLQGWQAPFFLFGGAGVLLLPLVATLSVRGKRRRRVTAGAPSESHSPSRPKTTGTVGGCDCWFATTVTSCSSCAGWRWSCQIWD